MNNILGHLFTHYIKLPFCISHAIHIASIAAKKYCGNIPNYRTYCLINNLIKQLKVEYTPRELYNLGELYINKNCFGELPESISQLQNLSELNLANNNLANLPESIGQMQNLQNLYVDNLNILNENIKQNNRIHVYI